MVQLKTENGKMVPINNIAHPYAARTTDRYIELALMQSG